MPRYRTEVVVPPDRYVCLQLPGHYPEGRATVTVQYHDPSVDRAVEAADDDEPDRDDFEWWEEFDSGTGAAG